MLVKADSRSVCRHVFRDDGIRANFGVIANDDVAQYFRASANIHMSANRRKAIARAGSYRDLLENQTIHPDHGAWMDDNPVGVRNEQTPTDLAG
jgi:hypothetical protein